MSAYTTRYSETTFGANGTGLRVKVYCWDVVTDNGRVERRFSTERKQHIHTIEARAKELAAHLNRLRSGARGSTTGRRLPL
jgi:hypothetical protein